MGPKSLTLLFSICVFLTNVVSVDEELETTKNENPRELGNSFKKNKGPVKKTEDNIDYCERFKTNEVVDINYHILKENMSAKRALGSRSNKEVVGKEGRFKFGNGPSASIDILKEDFSQDDEVLSQIICEASPIKLKSDAKSQAHPSIRCKLTTDKYILINADEEQIRLAFLECLKIKLKDRKKIPDESEKQNQAHVVVEKLGEEPIIVSPEEKANVDVEKLEKEPISIVSEEKEEPIIKKEEIQTEDSRVYYSVESNIEYESFEEKHGKEISTESTTISETNKHTTDTESTTTSNEDHLKVGKNGDTYENYRREMIEKSENEERSLHNSDEDSNKEVL